MESGSSRRTSRIQAADTIRRGLTIAAADEDFNDSQERSEKDPIGVLVDSVDLLSERFTSKRFCRDRMQDSLSGMHDMLFDLLLGALTELKRGVDAQMTPLIRLVSARKA